MPRIKLPRKSTAIDMTAMTDVSFLLLTFFILTAKFRPHQPVIIDTPTSRSELILPDPLMTISVDKEGKVFYSLSSLELKSTSLNNMIEKYGDKYPVLKNLSEQQKTEFANIEMMGFDVQQLPDILTKGNDYIQSLTGEQMPGIPIDSSNNQLQDWIMAGRYANPNMRVAIKGDSKSNIKTIQEVIKTLTNETVNVNTFNLITSLEGSGEAVKPE
ncbi:MAG: biopolymer transporter ExbD [Fimbriimonadaceae bacterium]|nr:biopolymer transporter ExbD [Chitinophagales bacterium]